jgi:hypothetical protein
MKIVPDANLVVAVDAIASRSGESECDRSYYLSQKNDYIPGICVSIKLPSGL